MIEKDLGRIATALEKIQELLTPTAVEAPPAAAVEAPPVTPAVEAPPAAAVEAPPAAAVEALSLKETADALGDEYDRLGGNRLPIDEAFAKFGCDGLNTLDPGKYGELLAAVRAIPAPGA